MTDFTGAEGELVAPPKPSDARSTTRSPEGESLSSVEIDTTAKGDPKIRVKVYARSNEPLEVQRAIDAGVDLYKRARSSVLRGWPGGSA